MIFFFQRKILRISTIFSNFKQNKQFSKKNSENFQGFYWNFSNFQIFTQFLKRNFWFCKIHHLWNIKLTYIQIEREKKKKLQKFIVRLTGEAKKGKFWTILENNLGCFWNSENGSKDFIEICQIFTQFSLNLVNESPKKIPAFIPKVVGDPWKFKNSSADKQGLVEFENITI